MTPSLIYYCFSHLSYYLLLQTRQVVAKAVKSGMEREAPFRRPPIKHGICHVEQSFRPLGENELAQFLPGVKAGNSYIDM